MVSDVADSPTNHFIPGDTVALRYITTRDGTVGASWPCRVVVDRDDLLALYIPQGATFKNWAPTPAASERRLADFLWRSDVLRLMFPGRQHSIWLFWSADERQFTNFYVNLEEPFRRTSIGFDTNDHALDIVVTPDLRWSWKDEDVFEQRVRDNTFSPAFAAQVRAEAELVILRIESRGSPFCDGWERWTPDPAWTIPLLTPTWDTEPPSLWARRAWAYPSAR